MTGRHATPEVRLRPYDRDAHRDLVVGWLNEAHVVRWWGRPEDTVPRLEREPDAPHALIEENGVPVGYLRWQRVGRQDLDAVGLQAVPDGSIDIDIFIGPPEKLGQGLGGQALEVLVAHLTEATDAQLAGLCTGVDNHHAIRAYEKAGFAKLQQFDDPVYGPCWVMARWLR